MSFRQIIKTLLPPGIRQELRPLLLKLSFLPPVKLQSTEELLRPFYRQMGILNTETELSGETFLIESVLPALLKTSNPTFFDIGANVGKYSSLLLQNFPSATIHAFEPSPETYRRLEKNMAGKKVRLVPKGLSDQTGRANFFDYGDVASSSHASLFSDVLKSLHKAKHIKTLSIELILLDSYLQSENLNVVDFIKIDTEGNELAALKGAKKSIKAGGLPLIQFEFNEMNVISRSFLRDFYEILPDYRFFRLMPHGLLPLGDYTSRNEIFAFQNILAVCPKTHSSSAFDPFLTSFLPFPPKSRSNNRNPANPKSFPRDHA
jgi:FkbM family methyltransferase